MLSPQRHGRFRIPGGSLDLDSESDGVSDSSQAVLSPISSTMETPVEVQSIAHLDSKDLARFISWISHPLAPRTAEFTQALNISGNALRTLDYSALSVLAAHDSAMAQELARIQLGLLPREPIREVASDASDAAVVAPAAEAHPEQENQPLDDHTSSSLAVVPSLDDPPPVDTPLIQQQQQSESTSDVSPDVPHPPTIVAAPPIVAENTHAHEKNHTRPILKLRTNADRGDGGDEPPPIAVKRSEDDPKPEEAPSSPSALEPVHSPSTLLPDSFWANFDSDARTDVNAQGLIPNVPPADEPGQPSPPEQANTGALDDASGGDVLPPLDESSSVSRNEQQVPAAAAPALQQVDSEAAADPPSRLSSSAPQPVHQDADRSDRPDSDSTPANDSVEPFKPDLDAGLSSESQALSPNAAAFMLFFAGLGQPPGGSAADSDVVPGDGSLDPIASSLDSAQAGAVGPDGAAESHWYPPPAQDPGGIYANTEEDDPPKTETETDLQVISDSAKPEISSHDDTLLDSESAIAIVSDALRTSPSLNVPFLDLDGPLSASSGHSAQSLDDSIILPETPAPASSSPTASRPPILELQLNPLLDFDLLRLPPLPFSLGTNDSEFPELDSHGAGKLGHAPAVFSDSSPTMLFKEFDSEVAQGEQSLAGTELTGVEADGSGEEKPVAEIALSAPSALSGMQQANAKLDSYSTHAPENQELREVSTDIGDSTTVRVQIGIHSLSSIPMTFSDDDGGSGAWSDQVGIDAAEVLPGPSASNGNSHTNAPTPESQQTSPSELRTPTESSDAVRKRDTELRPPRLGLIIPVSPTSLHEELFQHSPLLFSPISTSASALPLDLHLSGTGHRRAWSATDLERRSSESTAPFSSRSRSILSAGGSLFTEPDGVASESSQRLVKLRRGAANNRAPRGARTPNPNPNPNQRRYQSQGTDTADLVIAGDPPPELASELEVIRTYSDAVVQTVKAAVRNSDAMRINLELEAEVDRLRRRVVVLEGELRKASASSSSTSRRSSRSDSNPNPSRREDRAREAQHTRTHSASASAPRSFLVKAASTDRQVPPTVPFSFNFRNLSGSFMSGGQATTIATGNGRSTSRSSS